jgi:hypothetical protein
MTKWIGGGGSGSGGGGTAINVKDFGAVGDGLTDDTDAIRLAAATGRAVFFPAGTYWCAPNLDLASPRIQGAGRGDVTITLTAGNYLVDSNQLWVDTHIEGLTVVGGAGAIRNRFTGVNVTGNHTVIDCNFYDYTGPAISTSASDMPLWSIERCLFRGANQTTTVGVALNGLTDRNIIRGNEFQRNYVHIKLGAGGNNSYIQNNDFVQYSAPVGGLRRAFVWVVPAPSAVNSGSGFVLADNKCGNENLGVDDLRLAYADEGTGTNFGDRLPVYTADSAGYITGHTIRGGLFNGANSVGNPVVYSTTPNVRGCDISGLVLAGTAPSYIMQIRSPSTTLAPETAGNQVRDLNLSDQAFTPLTVTNQVGWVSPAQALESTGSRPTTVPGGGRAAGFAKLLSARIGAFTYILGASAAAVTDSLGGTDAAEITLTSGAGDLYAYPPAGALRSGTPVWIEFDLRSGTSDSVSAVAVLFGLDTSPGGVPSNYFRRIVAPASTWTPYRFLTYSPIVSDNVLLKFQRAAGGTGNKFQLGRVRMYHAREPLASDLVLPDVSTTTSAPTAGGGTALPATPAGYATVFINGTPRQIPYY